MRVLAFLLTAGLLLTGCVPASFDPAAAPMVKAYSQEQLDQAAAEIEALPPDSVLAVMVADYGVLRAQVRELWR